MTYRLFFLTSSVLLITALTLYVMGRGPICECGYIKLWHGQTWSSENSQHLTDWYTFSHIIHGFIFYYLIGKWRKHIPPSWRFFLAIIIESAWEIWENTPFIIDRYRAGTISLDYYGDSIVNSLFDIFAMIGGYWFASRFSVWITVSLLLLMEIGVGYIIRDNLLLNIIMIIYPFPSISSWQMRQ